MHKNDNWRKNIKEVTSSSRILKSYRICICNAQVIDNKLIIKLLFIMVLYINNLFIMLFLIFTFNLKVKVKLKYNLSNNNVNIFSYCNDEIALLF